MNNILLHPKAERLHMYEESYIESLTVLSKLEHTILSAEHDNLVLDKTNKSRDCRVLAVQFGRRF